MLISISGIVGSGKTTAEAEIVKALAADGIDCERWRFQTLPCFTIAHHRRTKPAPARPSSAVRGRGYSRKWLTWFAAGGYLAQMAAFRLYRMWSSRSRVVVCNRYFFDNLAHYRLDAPGARLPLAFLHTFMPKPDLALLMVASDDAIAARRPGYAPEYVTLLSEGYRDVARLFPELAIVNSNPDADTAEQLRRIVRRSVVADRM